MVWMDGCRSKSRASRLRHGRALALPRIFSLGRLSQPVDQIPGTREACGHREAIFAGIPVNVTLLFSRGILGGRRSVLAHIERRIDAG